jgi:hypothetical protein
MLSVGVLRWCAPRHSQDRVQPRRHVEQSSVPVLEVK